MMRADAKPLRPIAIATEDLILPSAFEGAEIDSLHVAAYTLPVPCPIVVDMIQGEEHFAIFTATNALVPEQCIDFGP